MAMRTIEIDFDIHKLIEAERRGFDEAPNDALRRLLKLPAKDFIPTVTLVLNDADGQRAWRGEGVTLSHGTKFRMEYGRPKRMYQGAIVDGEWVVNGEIFDSPSGAASGVAMTAKNSLTRLNGWILWEVQRPGESGWTLIDTLRKQVTSVLADQFLEKLGM
jgi:SeqA protein N-terminal domain